MMSKESFDLTPEVFRTLAESSVDAIAIGDLEGKQVYGNRACYDMFGYDYEKGEMMGSPLTSLWPEEDISILTGEVLPQAMAGGWSGEVGQKRKDDSLFDAYLTAFGLADEAGQPMGAVAIVLRDITERKRAEEALRISEERFILAEQGANDGIWDWDIQNNSLYWSPRFKKLLGYAPDELEAVFETFESHLHPDDNEHITAALEAHLKDRVPYDLEERLRTKSGEYRWFNARGQAIWDEDGNPIRMIGFVTDITERKRAEEALAEERNLLRTLLDNLPDLVYVKDTESRYVVSNAAHVRFLGGTTPDDVMGKTVFELYPQELAAQYYADDQKVIRSDQPLLKREERSVDHAGNRVWHLTTKVPLRDSEGEIVGLVGIARDITERKRAEEALRREHQQQEIIETQRQALRELSTPIVPVMEGVLVLPLVGSIDTRRAQQVMETLLEAIGRYQAAVVIIDITGVLVVDTGVANHLLQVTRAAGLLGSECVLVGISPEVAQTIVSLGVDLSSVVTQANLQSGIEHALKKTGRRIVKG